MFIDSNKLLIIEFRLFNFKYIYHMLLFVKIMTLIALGLLVLQIISFIFYAISDKDYWGDLVDYMFYSLLCVASITFIYLGGFLF